MKIIKKGEDEAEKEAMRSRQLQRSTPPQVKNSKYLLAELDLVANIVNSFHIYPKSTSLLQDQVANN